MGQGLIVAGYFINYQQYLWSAAEIEPVQLSVKAVSLAEARILKKDSWHPLHALILAFQIFGTDS